MQKSLVIFTIFILLLTSNVSLAESAATPSVSPYQSSKLEQLSWLTGSWHGEAMGGVFKETWHAPNANSMMGMFKLAKDGEVLFYEFLTIVETEDEVVLRLKHFDQNLVGWEEKDKSIEFKLLSINKDEAIFDGIEFKRLGQEAMQITVAISQGEEVHNVEFLCERYSL